MAQRVQSVDPSKFRDEQFTLWSIPSFDAGQPQTAIGAEIGSTKKLVQDGDILLSKIVPHIRRAWLVRPKDANRQIASSEWIVFRDQRFLPDFIRHFLLSDGFHNQFMGTVAGVGGSLLRAQPKEVAKIDIPLPPLDEQRRIVGLLDRAAEIRRRADAARAKARAIIPALFLDTFGDPATNPKGWPTAELGRHADVQGGVQVSAKRAALPVELPYLRVANVMRGRLDLTEIKMIRVTASEALRTNLVPGDVLVVEGHGNPNEIGRAAVWDGSITTCTHQNHLIRVRPGLGSLTPEYVETFLNSDVGRRILIHNGKTTSGLNTISTRNVKEVRIPLPPTGLQSVFAEQIQRIEALARHLDAAAAKAEAMAAGLSAEVFG
jgi:type I restriction enzyme S subunit